LPAREFAAGLAEVIKYGLIRDLAFFHWLEQNMALLIQQDPVALADAVRVSCTNKAEVVAEDEREGGIRAILNLGHTFGHAIETVVGYGEWLHGEAVAVGMLMAAELSCRNGWISVEEVQRVKAILQAANLPLVAPKAMTVVNFLESMKVDKKVLDGHIRLVLLAELGQAVVTSEIESDTLETLIADFCQ
jgi:3-dehydroquinate synthase